MDNNQNGSNNGPGNRKGPKNGQTIIIFLIVTVCDHPEAAALRIFFPEGDEVYLLYRSGE